MFVCNNITHINKLWGIFKNKNCIYIDFFKYNICDEFCGQIIKTLRLIEKKILYKQHACKEDNINNYYEINKLIKNNFKDIITSLLSKQPVKNWLYTIFLQWSNDLVLGKSSQSSINNIIVL